MDDIGLVFFRLFWIIVLCISSLRSEDCLTGKWGETCNLDCTPACEEGCHQNNGSCLGCKPGKHGSTCFRDCPTSCQGDCHQYTGFCTDCLTGKWGETCNLDCSPACEEGCHQNNGSCLGCKPGKHGSTCFRDCPTSCQGDCHQFTGFCTGSVVSDSKTDTDDDNINYIALAIGIVLGAACPLFTIKVICCWCRRRKIAKERQSKREYHSQSLEVVPYQRHNSDVNEISGVKSNDVDTRPYIHVVQFHKHIQNNFHVHVDERGIQENRIMELDGSL
ncbi:scavenger receptor class F member 1-like [Argopecten irradians]|uniref:scavenger receptor class F member 1-like n=1 Tax=Argopecten irradians TaxID=31199 RepID=UPI00371F9052